MAEKEGVIINKTIPVTHKNRRKSVNYILQKWN